MEIQKTSLSVTVNKNHLIAIGEQLYSKSIELIRELINNAYDADATKVQVILSEDSMEIRDNGFGMNLKGLKQYFDIGSPEKKVKKKSKVYRRECIGQFGIGKFAALAAGAIFQVSTQHEDFAATVTFDKNEWKKTPDSWDLPMEIYPPDPSGGDGTTVKIMKVTKVFKKEDIEKCIIESVPIRAPNFKVFIDDKQIVAREFTGQKIPFLEGTEFGPIHGEIYILPESRANADDLGINCQVKHVLVKKGFFGMETWGQEMKRIRGEVNANFLPITSDRSGFIIDTNEYHVFDQTMVKILKDVKRILGGLSDKKEKIKVKRALKEALNKVHNALIKNPDFSPFGAIPLAGNDILTPGDAGKIKGESRNGESAETLKKNKPKRKKKNKNPAVNRLTPGAVVQKLKLGQSGVSCCLDHFGSDGPECFTEETIIYINRDHPLYMRQQKKNETHIMHIARLLTQEISLMKSPKNPREAFERQSVLLKDAFEEEK